MKTLTGKSRMLKVYDFHCPNGHIFEKFVSSNVTASRCGCGENAKKMLSAPSFILDGSSGDFPSRHTKWIREHEQAGRRKPSP